jgi:hypothetical protein
MTLISTNTKFQVTLLRSCGDVWEEIEILSTESGEEEAMDAAYVQAYNRCLPYGMNIHHGDKVVWS